VAMPGVTSTGDLAHALPDNPAPALP
jgi:hypothetical protein